MIKTRSAFMMGEAILATVITGLIAVSASRILLSLQAQNRVQTHATDVFLNFHNAVDALRNRLLEADPESISFKEGMAVWRDLNSKSFGNAFLKEDGLYVNGLLTLRGAGRFEVKSGEEFSEILLCAKSRKSFCVRRFLRLERK